MDAAASRIDAFRDFYSRLIVATAGVKTDAERLTSAFRAVAREQFLPPGPWSVFTPNGYIQAPSNDPAILYQDVVVSLGASSGQINNGQPSLHAACLAALGPIAGETGLHVGAGSGYYTAILAHLVGAEGKIEAYEIDPDLAGRAAHNLAGYSQVNVHCRSGAIEPLPNCNFIYVNAGATHPADPWLDAMAPGGRLIFPLTPGEGLGGMLLLTRGENDRFAARFLSSVMFIPCTGLRDDSLAAALSVAFRTHAIWTARSFRRNEKPDETCCFAAKTWWLSTAEM